MCRHNFGDDIMHNCQDIEENRCFSNGGTNLHIQVIAQRTTMLTFFRDPIGL